MNKELSQAEVQELLSYDESSGKLFWKPRSIDLFREGKRTAQHIMMGWNSKNANKEAFTAITDTGYKYGRIFDIGYKAHRVIFLLCFGYWPKNIDHINGNRIDNRLCNLREVTVRQNQQNLSLRSDNKCGCTGVSFLKSREKYEAYIKSNGVRIGLGHYKNLEDAVAARKAAEIKYGFHPNHGRASC